MTRSARSNWRNPHLAWISRRCRCSNWS
jgi:hypothetical protein